ncbi:MAG: RNA-binding protein [Deltaproteobacteria bacterium]|nr:RNA-binding protein [Deltaproteobacteria bacterium]
MPTKLYVGNLAYSVTNEDLEALFSQAGKVESATVVVDKFSGRSRGFGFVEMADSEEAAKAVQECNDRELKGRNIRVDQARASEARPHSGGGSGRRDQGGRSGFGRRH